MSNGKIEVQNVDHAPSASAEYGSEMLAQVASLGAGDANVAIEALLLAAADLIVHNDGSVKANMASAQEKFEGLLNLSVEKHADCIKDLKARGIQHDHEIH